MFNFFKSTPEIEYEDRVWMDAGRKLDGICSQTTDATSRGKAVMIVAFFDETLSLLDSELRRRGITYQSSFRLDGRDGSGSIAAPVWLLPASQLGSRGQSSNAGAEDPDLYVLFAEHHPMLSRDRAALESAASLPFSSRIYYYTALDDELMKRFGGDRIIGLMQTLGHDEDTCLEHSMIASSIRNAQKKIEKKVGNDSGARSAEEWFRINMLQ